MKTYRRCGSLAGALVLLAALALPEAERAAAAPDGAGEGVEEWVVVLTDPRPARRRGWAAGVGYTGSVQYEDDPTLQRLARDIERAHEVSLVEQWPIRSLGVHCLKVRFTGDKEAVLSALRADIRRQDP